MDELLIRWSTGDIAAAKLLTAVLAPTLKQHVLDVTELELIQEAGKTGHSDTLGGSIDYNIAFAENPNWPEINQGIYRLVESTINKINRNKTKHSHLSSFLVSPDEDSKGRFGFRVRVILENCNGRDLSQEWFNPLVCKQADAVCTNKRG